MGYSFRSRLEPSEGGGLAVIQLKDLLNNNIVAQIRILWDLYF